MKYIRQVLTSISLLFVLMPAFNWAQDTTHVDKDPYLWLESVHGERALAWVKAQDDTTMGEFRNDSNFQRFQKEALEIMNAEDRIPYGNFMGGYVYNFWQDDEHVRGILRRATLDEYVKSNPQWETVLDIDKLNKEEGKSWVYKGSACLPPEYTRCMVSLSEGGKDAVVIREYDYNSQTFVKDGFYLPEAKGGVSWYDPNTLIVSTDFGAGSLTTSGYPRIVKLWKRGTSLSEAKTILEGENADVECGGQMEWRPEGNIFSLWRGVTFWTSINWVENSNLEKTQLPFPKDTDIKAYFKGYVIALLYSDWLGFPQGSLIAVKLADLKTDDLKSKVEVLYTPDERSTISGAYATKDYIILSILKEVRGKVLYFVLDESTGTPRWTQGELNLPDYGAVGVESYNAFNNVLMISFQDFLTPPSLFLLDDPKAEPKKIKTLPEKFNASNLTISQHEAKSKDGTMIPYFMVASKDLKIDGTNSTLLYGYGGFRASETPFYSGTIGKLWLENGGVYVLANIRGGGEFGPKWHKAALLKNRQKAYDDFIAVAEDLITRKITSARHLGIMGGSNGGLLVGAVFVERPDLFNAVVCQVPLLDMLRYTKLPPGASWMGEYGDPDSPEMRPYIEKYSPYQNVKSGVKYPQVLFVTSTGDDRVQPGHARKMAAKMEGFGDKVYFYEETEGGHGAAADNVQRAKRTALEYAYLMKMLR